jgi:hypothetical protein
MRERGDAVKDFVPDFVVSPLPPSFPPPTPQTHPNYANHLTIENRNLGTILDEHSVACKGKKRKTNVGTMLHKLSYTYTAYRVHMPVSMYSYMPLPSRNSRPSHPSLANTYTRAF